MFDCIESELEAFLGKFIEDFDVAGIISDIYDTDPNIKSIDDLPYETFIDIVDKHSK